MIFALIATLMGPVHADMARMSVEGMTCRGCQDKLTRAMNELDFVVESSASMASGLACATLNAPMQEAALKAVVEKLGYTLKSIEVVETCDPNTKRFPDNWAETDGLDVVIISRGEEVDLQAHRPTDKWTIFDFGAPWCAPCYAAEQLMKTYLQDHPDTAVRAIVLDSQEAKESFDMPVVHQHLQSAPGLPYFIVMDPKGKTVFRGSEVAKMLKKLDKKR